MGNLPIPRDCDHCDMPLPVPTAREVFQGQQVCPNCHATQLPSIDRAAYMEYLEAQVAALTMTANEMAGSLRRIERMQLQIDSLSQQVSSIKNPPIAGMRKSDNSI